MFFISPNRKPWQRYSVAIVAVVIAAVVRVEFLGLLGPRIPYVTFFPAVTFVALYSGLPAGLLATALAASFAFYWLEPSGHIFIIQNQADQLDLVIFTLSCVTVCFVAKALHDALDRAAEAESKSRIFEQRSLTEAKLRESEVRYNALFSNKIIAMAHCRVITDEQGRPVDYLILQVNDAYEQIIGIQKSEIEGRRVTEVFPGVENYSFDYIGELGKVGLQGGEITSETYLEATRQYLSIYTYSPLPGEFTTIFNDVTERKQVELEREQFFTFFSTSTDLMCIADPLGAFKKVNPACSKTLGYTEAELLSKPFMEFIHPDDKQPTLDEMKRQLEIGQSLNFENRYICKDGSLCWLSWRAIYSREEGTTYATARDITGRKLMEAQLRDSEAHYRLLTEDVSDVVWKMDRDYRFTYVSPADEQLRGYRGLKSNGTKTYAKEFRSSLPAGLTA